MINFRLISSSGVKFDSPVYEVVVPTEAGVVALFEDHMPMVSAGSAGVISVRKKAGDSDQSMENFAVAGGVVEVDGKNVNFVSDDVATADDVSEAEAEAALARAEELMKSASNQIAINEAKQLMHHSSAKLHIAKLKKRRHQ